jgi:hypothetical protein
MQKWMLSIFTLLVITLITDSAIAHHVLGRPAYALNEDSNTPSSLQGETQIGDYFVTYMVFPAFPKPKEQGRINLYVKRLDNGETFPGKITFKIRNDTRLSWLGVGEDGETIGVQPPDDKVFRQGFVFNESGDYMVSAQFSAGGEPYNIDFPLRVGAPSSIGPIGIVVGVLILVLVGISLIQRRRAMTGKVRSEHS